MLVPKHGLHKDKDGVWWLLQSAGATNAINLPAAMCELQVAPGVGRCIHDIDITETVSEGMRMLEKDLSTHYSLFNFLNPVPHIANKLTFLPVSGAKLQKTLHVLMKFQAMFSPVRDVTMPMWSGKNAVTSLSSSRLSA